MAIWDRNEHPKSILTLSAVPGPDRELARDTAWVARELARADRIRRRGEAALADRYIDQLIDAIIAPAISESELRLLDGNR